MKRILLFVFTLFLASNLIGQDTPPPPPPPPPAQEEKLFKVVEEMPRFPGCEHITDKKQKSECASQELLMHIYKNLKYPPEARHKGTEGIVYVQFTVKEDGMIGDINVVRKLDSYCDQAAIDVIESMNDLEERWIPGKQRGRSVNVLFTLPIKFRLGNQSKK